MREFVFVGPSLATAEAAALRPGATILPPVAHGDLLRLDARPGDVVFLIDGLFMRVAPVRHREILHLLRNGVTVAGSSSMGALRAAELWPLGMRGVGEIFEMYRDGVITGDDEVAIVHGPAEEGHRALSVPLANIRVALRRATAAAVLTPAEQADLVALAAAMPFRMRGYRQLERAARRDLAGDAIDRFLAWHAANPVDAKAEDARRLLSRPAAPAPHDGSDRPIENVDTAYFASWKARHGGAAVGDRWVGDAAAIAAVMLLHPRFPAEHRAAVLARIGDAEDATDPEAAALSAARRLGLLAGEPRDSAAWAWLGPAEHELAHDEAVLRVLSRSFGTAVHAAIGDRQLPPALARSGALDQARGIVAAAERINERLPRPDPRRPERRMRFRTEVIDRTFAGLWGCDDLTAAVNDRGFADLDAFRLAAEPLVAYVKTVGAPDSWPLCAVGETP
ncbi:TfuA-like protein [Actinoplanes sp. HUAS TT8]|uniref:TfuA-like protein n=1 Tax=Actinoplanes sp. HUAS TT8 TaxID=3447453 RepID=UPI003F52083F